MLKRFLREEQGMEMVEWALVAILFAIAAGVAYTTLAGGVVTAMGNIVTALTGV